MKARVGEWEWEWEWVRPENRAEERGRVHGAYAHAVVWNVDEESRGEAHKQLADVQYETRRDETHQKRRDDRLRRRYWQTAAGSGELRNE